MSSREQPKRTIKLKSPLVPILVLLLLGVQLFFPFKGWVILLSGFGGMWLLSFFWAQSLKRHLSIEREIRFGWKQVGDSLRERVILDNHGWAPALWIEIDDHSNLRDYGISSVTEIRGGRSQNWHTQGVCNYRGLYTLGPVTLVTGDPFGLYSVTIDYLDSVNMMVAPPVISLPDIQVASGGGEGEGRSAVKALLQTVSSTGVREYVPGDSLRWLHWPTTIRKGTPYVRVFEDQPTSDWWVVLDLDSDIQVGEGPKSTEEHGVILTASLVNHGLALGKKVGLVAHASEMVWHPPDLGESHLWSVLRSLAKIRPGKTSLPVLLKRIQSSLGKRSSLIVVTANLSSQWLRSLELIQRRGIVPTVLLLDPVSFGGKGDVKIIREWLTKLGVTHHVITSELIDRPESQPEDKYDWLLHHPSRSGRALGTWEEGWLKLTYNFWTYGLILLFYFGLVRTIRDAVRGLESNLLWLMIAGGIGVGWLLNRSRLRGWIVAVLHMIGGWFIASLQIGRLGNPIQEVFIRFFTLISQTTAWVLRDASAPNIELFMLSLSNVWVGIRAVGFRILGWLFDLLQGQPFYDPVVAAFLWGVAVWGTAAWALWSITRHKKPLIGLLPATALVVISLALIRYSSNNLALMFGATSALVVYIQHDTRERQWREEQKSYGLEIRSRITGIAVLLAAGLMVLSIFTPALSLDRLADVFRRLTGESNPVQEFTSSLGLESRFEEKDIYILDLRRVGSLPNRHLIGSGPELSEQVVMVFRLEELQTGIQDSEVTSQTPIYLRSLVYDQYTGRGWASGGTQIEGYSPGEQLPIMSPPNAKRVRQQVQFIEDSEGILFSLGYLLTVDQDYQVAWRDYDEVKGIYDIFGATVDGETYRADSVLPIFSEVELRSAGQDYPDWIKERYLSLPATVPDSVLTLALDLTATEPTPYDRAVAIEKYLREIPYSTDVDTGPPEQDISEYFLFDLKKGYCDYYATAMVVLSRSAGFPARYVMGYIAEDYDQDENLYVITADQAHAWVEVYFPGYGWVPFEPTAARSEIDRPADRIPELPEDFTLEFSPIVEEQKLFFKNYPWLFILISSVLITCVGALAVSEWWLAHIPVDSLVVRLYKRVYRYARWIGLSVDPGETAFQFSNSLDKFIYQVSQGNYWGDWFRQSSSMIEAITQTLMIIMFYDPKGIRLTRQEILKTFRKLRTRLWFLWLMLKAYQVPILRKLCWFEPSPFLIELGRSSPTRLIRISRELDSPMMRTPEHTTND